MNPLENVGNEDVEVEGGNPSEGMSIDESFAVMTATDVKRKLSSSTITLGLVVLLAGAGLFSMRMITSAVAESTSTELSDEVRNALKPSAAPVVPPADVIETLTTDVYDVLQVPLDNVFKNPFVIFGETRRADVGPDVPAVTRDPMEERRAEWLDELSRQAQGLVVKSIMGGGRKSALANVNGKIVRIGDFVGGDDRMSIRFNVIRITSEAVILRAASDELSIEQDVEVLVRPRI